MNYLSNLNKQSQHQIHATNKGRCYFYQNFLHLILRNMIKERIYTANKLKITGQSDQS